MRPEKKERCGTRDDDPAGDEISVFVFGSRSDSVPPTAPTVGLTLRGERDSWGGYRSGSGNHDRGPFGPRFLARLSAERFQDHDSARAPNIIYRTVYKYTLHVRCIILYTVLQHYRVQFTARIRLNGPHFFPLFYQPFPNPLLRHSSRSRTTNHGAMKVHIFRTSVQIFLNRTFCP